MSLSNENYYSKDSDAAYMSASQFKDFLNCEAAALAKFRKEWVEPKSTALLVGSYVDAHFEGTLDIFKAQNPEIFKRDGTLKSDYEQANIIIERIERDEVFMWALSGEKQKIITGEISGVPFKGKIDSYHPSDLIVDLKIIRDFNSVWIDGQGKVPFVHAWGYDIQGAIYQSLEGSGLPFVIAAATKEKPEPDISVMRIPDDVLGVALGWVRDKAPYYQALKRGEGTPFRCGKCDYCKSTKVLQGVVDYREVV